MASSQIIKKDRGQTGSSRKIRRGICEMDRFDTIILPSPNFPKNLSPPFLPWLSGNGRDDKFDCHLSSYRPLSPASSTLMLTTLQ
jgi:hypothetical protein